MPHSLPHRLQDVLLRYDAACRNLGPVAYNFSAVSVSCRNAIDGFFKTVAFALILGLNSIHRRPQDHWWLV